MAKGTYAGFLKMARAKRKLSSNNTVGNPPFKYGNPSAPQRIKGAGDKVTEDNPNRVYRPGHARGSRGQQRPT
jgi:hypothetical protein